MSGGTACMSQAKEGVLEMEGGSSRGACHLLLLDRVAVQGVGGKDKRHKCYLFSLL
jgi:hypothetical protein